MLPYKLGVGMVVKHFFHWETALSSTDLSAEVCGTQH